MQITTSLNYIRDIVRRILRTVCKMSGLVVQSYETRQVAPKEFVSQLRISFVTMLNISVCRPALKSKFYCGKCS